MGITGKYTIDNELLQYFGEHNTENKLHGRGILIKKDGQIRIQSWHNGDYIIIARGGFFVVAE